ncbi:MATH domain and coiled-coil domain-containing protein At3g58360-like [Malania oleifera]|uniref:MATH domain and coiled-coil domain-containing protein At3g58360-like n=1 Tax=Malania oleifera TaxID=397392 RepID=UPI0025AE9D56|nr:MATH domain and coiled-coil domain-containing protein At3g58360-like [Malania oleifera]
MKNLPFPPGDLEGRDAPPCHYTFKIQSFSMLSAASVEKVCSEKFEAGDYKWKLIIYPKGDKSRDGQGHVSIYLALVDTNTLPAGWEVNVIFKLFVFNDDVDQYFYNKDESATRFHAMKTERGFPRFIELPNFTNSSNGFLVNDTCVFGAEVFVLKQTHKGECLSMIKKPASFNYTWKIENFTGLMCDRHESESFIVGDYKWKIMLYPNGNGEGKGNSISLFLCLEDTITPADTKLFVKFILRLLNQTGKEDYKFETDNLFSSSCLVWGSQKFISLAKLKDPKNCFLLWNSCIIVAELKLLGSLSAVS